LLYAGHDKTCQAASRKTEEGSSLSVPRLPGCRPEGQTDDEAIANIQEAMKGCLEVAGALASEATITEFVAMRSDPMLRRQRP